MSKIIATYPQLNSAAALCCTAVAISLSVPPLRSVIEQSMAWHMVFQMPLLVLSGWLVARTVLPFFLTARSANAATVASLSKLNQFSLTGFMAAQFIVAYWMLPLAIDRAVVLPAFDLLKLLSLFVCGVLLADVFKRAPSILQLFFMGYLVSMMAWLGVYFATTDLRLCNAYSLESQARTGWGLLALGVVLGASWLAAQFRQPAALNSSEF